uniref:Lymphocyte activation 3 protein n=1 Tax=Ginglymostoma cirratum TaxID=7801 RepID=V9NEJ8_GINCI|nr:lymphocyte activation 3 protein [Ginglymostoma cirratum]
MWACVCDLFLSLSLCVFISSLPLCCPLFLSSQRVVCGKVWKSFSAAALLGRLVAFGTDAELDTHPVPLPFSFHPETSQVIPGETEQGWLAVVELGPMDVPTSPLVRLCGIFLLLITALPPGSRVSPYVTEGDTVYACQGETITLLCQVPDVVSRPITSPPGFWKWTSADGTGTTLTILQYLSSVRSNSFSKLSARSRISERRQFGNFSLLISSLDRSDSGSYSCEFSFGRSQARATWQLRVIEVKATMANPLIETQRVELTCEGSVQNVSWSGPLGPAGKGRTLALSNLAVQHQGDWVCTCWFPGGTVQSRYQLDVVGLNEPLDKPVFLPVSSAFLLPCRLNKALLPLKAAWYQDGQELITLKADSVTKTWSKPQVPWVLFSSSQPITNLSVMVRAVTLAQGGTFECRVTLKGVTIRRMVNVTLIEVRGSHPTPVPVGTNMSLVCNVSSHSGQTGIRWRSPSTMEGLEDRRVRGEGSLLIRLIEVTQRHVGDWICEISQGDQLCGQGTYSLNITTLTLSEFGDPPLVLIIAASVGAFVLLLLATVIAVCLSKRARRRRRALKRLRHPLCREHSYQLSNQPLCHSNDYTPGDRPLPPPPIPYCPHRQPRKGRPSHARGSRHARRSQFGP